MSERKPPNGPRKRVLLIKKGEVGYAKPPRDHRFKPGRSGNPKGRPKGRKNEATIWDELLSRKIPIREGGRKRMITVQEAIQFRIVEDCLKGNIKSSNYLLNRQASLNSGESNTPVLEEDEREILQDYFERYKKNEAK